MSLIPPSAFILSKMKYYLKKALEDELYDQVIEKLKPLYVFRLSVQIRPLNGRNEISEIEQSRIDEILGEASLTDDCDKILFLYKRIMDRMKDTYTDACCIRTAIQASFDSGERANIWQDCMVDEFFTGVELKQ